MDSWNVSRPNSGFPLFSDGFYGDRVPPNDFFKIYSTFKRKTWQLSVLLNKRLYFTLKFIHGLKDLSSWLGNLHRVARRPGIESTNSMRKLNSGVKFLSLHVFVPVCDEKKYGNPTIALWHFWLRNTDSTIFIIYLTELLTFFFKSHMPCLFEAAPLANF